VPGTDLQNLTAALSRYSAHLANLAANPPLTYTRPDGRTVSNLEGQQFIIREMEELRRQIQVAGGPFEGRSIAR
jgi:hypothetical protein